MNLCAVLVGAVFTATLVGAIPGERSSAAVGDVASFEIYSVQLDGTGKRNLTRNPLDDFAPSVSPNGRKVAFVRATTPDNWDLWIMNADGSNQRQLTTTEDPELDPVWSPDGSLIAFTSHAPSTCIPHDCGDWTIWVMRADGSNVRRVGKELGEGRYPRWSPSGRRLAFELGIGSDSIAGSIGVAELSGGGRQLLYQGGWEWPSWSPDGRRLSFSGGSDDGRSGIFVHRFSASSTKLLLKKAFQPEWSPTRDQIAFRVSSERRQVRVISLRAARVRRVGFADRFAWNRRGSRLVLFRTGRDIRVVDPDGGAPRVVVRNPGQFEHASVRITPWVTSPSDRRLYYSAKGGS